MSNDHPLGHVRVGDSLRVKDSMFDVLSRNVRVSSDDGLTGLTFNAPGTDEPLTNGTVSRLRVDREPYELDVCNGLTREIDSTEMCVADE